MLEHLAEAHSLKKLRTQTEEPARAGVSKLIGSPRSPLLQSKCLPATNCKCLSAVASAVTVQCRPRAVLRWARLHQDNTASARVCVRFHHSITTYITAALQPPQIECAALWRRYTPTTAAQRNWNSLFFVLNDLCHWGSFLMGQHGSWRECVMM